MINMVMLSMASSNMSQALGVRTAYYDSDPNLYGAPKDPMEEYRLERLNGTLTKLSGFNYADDKSVTKLNIAGNTSMDEDFLQDLFERYYTYKKEKGKPD